MTRRGGDDLGFDDATELSLRHRAKNQIRKRIRAVRGAVPAEARAARSAEITQRVLGLDAWASARVVAGYVAMRGEADPASLLTAAREGGRTVALPRVDWVAETMELRAVGAEEELEESGMGFLQPAAGAPRVDDGDVDLVLIPALAADERGYRIGWGKGFYDRLLPSLSRAVRVALVFDFQLVAEVPDTPGDERVDYIVTDDRVVHTARALS